jgi:hypothetical protein
MQKLLFVVFALLFSFSISAQAKKTFKVEPGQKVVDAIPITELYSYSEFKPGAVTLKDNTSADVKLNYNNVFGEMQFIDPKTGDTISLADEKNIRFVAVEKDTIYFDDGWMLQISNNQTIKIARKKMLEMSNKEKVGAMEVPGFAAIETYTKFTGAQHMKDLVAKEKLTFTGYIYYYFGDRFNHFGRANKKGLLKIYGEKQKQITQWLDDNKIDLTKEEDLKKLAAYLQDL